MAAKGIASILNSYFNVAGDTGSLGGQVTLPNGTVHLDLPVGMSAKRPVRDFADEMKRLSDEEKYQLAVGVCALDGSEAPAPPKSSAE